MASPQKENGYTPISNELMEALSRARLTGQEFRLVMHILRQTYGYARKEYTASLAKIGEAIGMNRISVKKISDKLLAHRVTVVSPQGNRRPLTYRINKDYDTWCYPTGQQSSVTPQANSGVTPQANSGDILPMIRKKKERNKEIKRKIRPKRTSEFNDHFWPAYPLKKSKKKALAIWESLSQKNDLPPIKTILSAIDAQKKEKKALCDANKFCPEWKHPTTWLNHGCWDDEPIVTESGLSKEDEDERLRIIRKYRS